MVVPFTSSVAREVLQAVPVAQREGAYALGATRWEAIRVALHYGRTGIHRRHHARLRPRARRDDGRDDGDRQQRRRLSLSLFAPQYTMAAVIANEFTEAADELYLHALIEIGLVLFIITLFVNGVSRLLIWQDQPARVAGARAGLRRWRLPERRMSSPRMRAGVSIVMTALCGAAVLFALLPLGFILFFVVTRGVQSLTVDFFTHMPTPVGEPGGGMANAIVGTLMVTALGAHVRGAGRRHQRHLRGGVPGRRRWRTWCDSLPTR